MFPRAETSDQTDLQRTGQLHAACRAVPHGTRFAGRAGRPSTRPCSSCRLPLRCGCLHRGHQHCHCSAYARARPPACAAAYGLGRWIRCERIPTLGFWLISTITILILFGSLSIDHILKLNGSTVYRVRRSIWNRWQICGRREQGLIGKLSRTNKSRVGFFFIAISTHMNVVLVCVFFFGTSTERTVLA